MVGVDGVLKELAKAALQTKPNFAYTLAELQADVHRLYDLGYFASTQAKPEDTRDGVKITYVVSPNPDLKGVVVSGSSALPQSVVEGAFRGQYGQTVNFHRFSDAIAKLQGWYDDHGYFGQVVDVDVVGNTAEIKITEAVVSDVRVRFTNPEGAEVPGKTQSDVVLRQMSTQRGKLYSLAQARADIESIYSMGIFEDVSVTPTMDTSTENVDDNAATGGTCTSAGHHLGNHTNPGLNPNINNKSGGPQRVLLQVNLTERKSGGLSAGGGISASAASEGSFPGFVGNVAYSQRNMFGMNQKLTVSTELGQSDALFRLHHLNPWCRGDAYRTSRSIQIQNTRMGASSVLGHARHEEDGAGGLFSSGGVRGGGRPNATNGNAVGGNVTSLRNADGTSSTTSAGGGPNTTNQAGPGPGPGVGPGPGAGASPAAATEGSLTLGRLQGSVEWTRPLTRAWNLSWSASLQRTRCFDETGRPVSRDQYHAPVTFSGDDSDCQASVRVQVSCAPLVPGATHVLASLEGAAPPPAWTSDILGDNWLSFARARGRVYREVQVGPWTMTGNLKGGHIVGDLPAYEAFPIGGTDSVRGYEEGGVGTGRSFVTCGSEVRFPLMKSLAGCVFFDYGSDLGTGEKVSGDPAGTRGKPGVGHGVGAGVRMESPVGALRLEYAFNHLRKGRFHFGIGSQG